jgi:hypothetical protein
VSLGSPGGDEIAWPAPVFAGDELRAGMEVLGATVPQWPGDEPRPGACADAARRRGDLPQHVHGNG